jgi:hypothetical protein
MPPLRDRLTPGVRTSRSTTSTVWLASICFVVRTVTDWPTRSAAWAERLAVTMTSPSRVESSTCAGGLRRSGAGGQEKRGRGGAQVKFRSHSGSNPLLDNEPAERGRDRMRTRPVTTALARGPTDVVIRVDPVPLGTPRPREGRPRRAGLLAHGSTPVRTAFPDRRAFTFGVQWLMVRGLAAYSCVGSPGFTPEFPFHPHRWGTCREAAIRPKRRRRQWSVWMPTTLVLGGARSGKTAHAQNRAESIAAPDAPAAGDDRHGPGLRRRNDRPDRPPSGRPRRALDHGGGAAGPGRGRRSPDAPKTSPWSTA